MRTCEPFGIGVSSSCTSNDSFGLTILADFMTTTFGRLLHINRCYENNPISMMIIIILVVKITSSIPITYCI
jgi:hypothetical protein